MIISGELITELL